MLASIIIDTSLAPSPIARVTHLPLDLNILTTSAFYLGDILQQTTDLDLIEAWKNMLHNSSSSRITVNVFPSMVIT
jgi:hypothetical protein